MKTRQLLGQTNNIIDQAIAAENYITTVTENGTVGFDQAVADAKTRYPQLAREIKRRLKRYLP